MAKETSQCPVCKAGLASSVKPRQGIEPGNIYAIRMSIFTPLYTFVGQELPSALSYYPSNCRKRPRPCVVFQRGGTKKNQRFTVCLMGTFHKKPYDALEQAFQDRVLPVFSTRWDESAITTDGKEHIHTTPQTSCPYPSYIIPVPVQCKAEDLEDWKADTQGIAPSGAGPSQPCRHYLDHDDSQLGMLRDEVAKHRGISDQLVEDPEELQKYLDTLEHLRKNRPPDPSTMSITSKGTRISNSGFTHNSTFGGCSRRTHITFCESSIRSGHRPRKSDEGASVSHSVADQAESWRAPLSRKPPSVGQRSIGKSDVTSLSSRTQSMSLQGDSSEADRVSTKTGTGRKMNFMNKFRASDNRSVKSGIGSVFNFQPSSSKYGKQPKAKTASISSNRFSLLQPSIPPPVSPVAG